MAKKRYMTKRQFAEALGIAVRTVERKVNAGVIRLAGRTLGGHWRFDLEELERCRTTHGVIRNWTKPAFVVRFERRQVERELAVKAAFGKLRQPLR